MSFPPFIAYFIVSEARFLKSLKKQKLFYIISFVEKIRVLIPGTVCFLAVLVMPRRVFLR